MNSFVENAIAIAGEVDAEVFTPLVQLVEAMHSLESAPAEPVLPTVAQVSQASTGDLGCRASYITAAVRLHDCIQRESTLALNSTRVIISISTISTATIVLLQSTLHLFATLARENGGETLDHDLVCTTDALHRLCNVIDNVHDDYGIQSGTKAPELANASSATKSKVLADALRLQWWVWSSMLLYLWKTHVIIGRVLAFGAFQSNFPVATRIIVDAFNAITPTTAKPVAEPAIRFLFGSFQTPAFARQLDAGLSYGYNLAMEAWREQMLTISELPAIATNTAFAVNEPEWTQTLQLSVQQATEAMNIQLFSSWVPNTFEPSLFYYLYRYVRNAISYQLTYAAPDLVAFSYSNPVATRAGIVVVTLIYFWSFLSSIVRATATGTRAASKLATGRAMDTLLYSNTIATLATQIEDHTRRTDHPRISKTLVTAQEARQSRLKR